MGLIVAVSILWGLNWPAMKVAVGEISPWPFRSFCVLVSGGGLLLIARLWGERLVPTRESLPALIGLAFCGVTLWHMFSAFGLVHIGGGRGGIVAYTMPVWAALMSATVLRERIPLRTLLALVGGMLGIVLLVVPDLARGDSLIGHSFMVAAAVAWAAGVILLKRRVWPIGILALTGWQLLLGGVPIVLATLVVEPVPDLSALTWKGAAGTLYAATVALIFCYAAHNKLVTLLPATVAAISTLAVPVVGLASSAWLLGEPVGALEIVALALVVGAVGLVVIRPRRPPLRPATAP